MVRVGLMDVLAGQDACANIAVSLGVVESLPLLSSCRGCRAPIKIEWSIYAKDGMRQRDFCFSRYDVSTNSWHQCRPLPPSQNLDCRMVSLNGQLHAMVSDELFCGKVSFFGRYSVASDAWDPLPLPPLFARPWPSKFDRAGSHRYQNQIRDPIVHKGTMYCVFFHVLTAYTPRHGWIILGPSPSCRRGADLLAVDDFLYVLGGSEDFEWPSEQKMSPIVERYRISDGAWETLPDIPENILPESYQSTRWFRLKDTIVLLRDDWDLHELWDDGSWHQVPLPCKSFWQASFGIEHMWKQWLPCGPVAYAVVDQYPDSEFEAPMALPEEGATVRLHLELESGSHPAWLTRFAWELAPAPPFRTGTSSCPACLVPVKGTIYAVGGTDYQDRATGSLTRNRLRRMGLESWDVLEDMPGPVLQIPEAVAVPYIRCFPDLSRTR